MTNVLEDRDLGQKTLALLSTGEFGHIQVRCPKFRENLKCLKELKGKSKGDSSVNVVNTDDEIFLSNTVAIECNSSWMMNFIADIHICTNRDLFDTLHTEGDFDYVNMENNLK